MKDIRIELGSELKKLISSSSRNLPSLQNQIQQIRKELLTNLGFPLGPVNLVVSGLVDNDQYRIIFDEKEVGFGEVVLGHIMAIPPKHNSYEIAGISKKEPVFGKDVTWIDEKKHRKLSSRGFKLFSDAEVIGRHLSDLVEKYQMDLFQPEDVTHLLASLSENLQLNLVEPLLGRVSQKQLFDVLHLLMEENIPLKPMGGILRQIEQVSKATTNVVTMADYVREELSGQIVSRLKDKKGVVTSITLSNEWEHAFKQSCSEEGDGTQLSMQNDKLLNFLDSLQNVRKEFSDQGENPVLLTRASTRRLVREATKDFAEDIVVLSQSEIPPELNLRNLGFV